MNECVPSVLVRELSESMVFQSIMKYVQGWIEGAVAKAFQEYKPIREPEREIPSYYTREQVKDILHISYPTLHSLMNKSAIKFVKVGKKTLFPCKELDAQVLSGELRKYRRTC